MSHEQTPAEQIISDFLRLRHKSEAYTLMLNLARSHPEQLSELFYLGLEETPDGATFFDAALSYLPEEDFPGVAGTAVNKLIENPENELAADIVAYIAIQFPHFLHPHLDTIFKLDVNGSSYYAHYPWRESAASSLEFLTSVINDEKQRAEIRQQALFCLLETRDPEILKTAANLSPDVNLRHPMNLYFEGIGFELDGDEIESLYNPVVYHLIFEKSYLESADRPYFSTEDHPTWQLKDENAQTAKFGGNTETECAICSGKLHHLITFDPPLPDFPVSWLQKLTLATCLSCLGWEEQVLFYKHDKNGQPTPFGYEGEPKTPEFPTAGFCETTVQIVRTPDRWKWQDWGLSNSRENLHRINGFPCWVQSSEHPSCPGCEKKMKFFLQLDSDLPILDDSHWYWGSGGIGYCLWCDSCRISSFLWQCT